MSSRGTECQYWLYSGFGNDVPLRKDANGSLYLWDDQKNTRSSLRLSPDDNGVFRPMPNPCGQTGRVVTRSAKYKGPIGEFDTALEIRYSPGTCADAGVERELYLPYIGLVQRTVTCIRRTTNL